jgi:hypothetical protein
VPGDISDPLSTVIYLSAVVQALQVSFGGPQDRNLEIWDAFVMLNVLVARTAAWQPVGEIG